MSKTRISAIAVCLILAALVGWALRPHLIVRIEAPVSVSALPAPEPTYPRIDVTVAGLDKGELGSVATVQFKVAAGMPARAPIDHAIEEYPNETHGTLRPRWLDGSRLDLIVISVPNTVRLNGKGFIVIPPGQPMPFGAHIDDDALRVVFPLYAPEAEPAGSVGVRPLQAGSFHLTVRRIAVTTEGQLRANETLFAQSWDLTDHAPVITVQDRFTAPRPNSIFVSPSGQHELWVYRGRFDIFNAASGGRILNLVGENPVFSPTGRFLTYANQGRTLVVDVLARQQIHASDSGVIAFMAGDAYLYANKWFGQFDFLAPFVDSDYRSVAGAIFNPPDYSSSHGCRSCIVLPTKVRLDTPNGLLWVDSDVQTIDTTGSTEHLPDSDPGKRVYDVVSLLTGVSWLSQIPFDETIANRVRELFNHPPVFGLTRDKEFAVGNDDEEEDNGSELSSYLVQMRAGTISASSRPPSRNHGEPVLRAIDAPTVAFRSSDVGRIREFLHSRGLEFPNAFRAKETGQFEMSDAFDDKKFTTKYHALFARLGRGHKLVAVEEPIDQDDIPEKTVLSNFDRNAGAVDPKVYYKVWETSLGRVISIARSEYLPRAIKEELSVCLLLITNRPRRDAGRCLGEENFYPGGFGPIGTVGVVEVISDDQIAVTTGAAQTLFILDTASMTVRAKIEGVRDAGAISYLAVSSDKKFFLQCNRDGTLFVYNLTARTRALSGMLVDDEIVVFDDAGHYDSTAEGAHYVYWLFPGLNQHFAFSQFESRMHRPDVIQAILRGELQTPTPIDLTAPPVVDIELSQSGSLNRGLVRVLTTGQSQTALKSIRLFVDGMPVNEVPASGKSTTAERDVPITRGIHWVTAVAYDTSGYSSVPKSVMASGAESPLPNGRLFYLGVAIDEYPGIPNANLRYAKRDVQLIAETLKTRASGQYRDANPAVLTDAAATSEAILAELRRVALVAEPEDTLIVSFSGHGITGKDGRFLFATSAATAGDPANGALDWNDAASILAASRAKIIVLLDACHSGFASQGTVMPNDTYAAMLMRNHKPGMAVLAASKGRELAQERSGLKGGHGLFSYAVARALGEDRANADLRHTGVIDLDALYQYVKDYVSKEARNSNFPQTPWLSRDEMIGRVPIL
jgi:hypothetical protein